MIRVTEKITETDQERAESLNYIESINEEKSFLDLKDPYAKKVKKATRATHDPLTHTVSEVHD